VRMSSNGSEILGILRHSNCPVHLCIGLNHLDFALACHAAAQRANFCGVDEQRPTRSSTARAWVPPTSPSRCAVCFAPRQRLASACLHAVVPLGSVAAAAADVVSDGEGTALERVMPIALSFRTRERRLFM